VAYNRPSMLILVSCMCY